MKSNEMSDLLARISLRHSDDQADPGWCDLPWNDPDVSRRILELHLDPDVDHASRPHHQIEAEVAFIDGVIGGALGHRARICDLACGPGLYASRFAARGHRVIGVDHGPASIRHAREQAEIQKHAVEFIEEDIRRVAFGPDRFDVTVMIFAQANAFHTDDLRDILTRARAWTSPDGLLIFDMVPRWRLADDIGRSWSVLDSSVFCDTPHLWLEDKRFFARAAQQVCEFVVVDLAGDSVANYCVHHVAYKLPEIELLLRETGWRLETVFGDLLGNPYRDGSSSWLVPVARPSFE